VGRDGNGGGQAGVSGEALARLNLDVMLTEANRLRSRGLLGEANAKCREALAANQDYWPAYELMGDIFKQQGRASDAIEAYRAALQLNPERVAVEDKMARACVTLAQQRYAYLWAEDALAEGERKRNPIVSSLLSALVPGLGQFHNRRFAKGLALTSAAVLLALMVAVQALSSLVGRTGGVQGYVSVFFSGRTLYVTALLIAVWLWAVIDAAVRA